jgi:hypothetical protein
MKALLGEEQLLLKLPRRERRSRTANLDTAYLDESHSRTDSLNGRVGAGWVWRAENSSKGWERTAIISDSQAHQLDGYRRFELRAHEQ